MHRFTCSLPIKIATEPETVECKTIDIHVGAIKVNTALEGSIGQRFDVAFNSALAVAGILVRKTKDTAVLKLLYNEVVNGYGIQALIDQRTYA